MASSFAHSRVSGERATLADVDRYGHDSMSELVTNDELKESSIHAPPRGPIFLPGNVGTDQFWSADFETFD